MFHFGIDGKTSRTLTKLVIKMNPLSLSEFFQALRIVGRAAKQSPSAAKSTAPLGESTPNQTKSANTEQAPQIKSKVVSFQ